MKMKYKLIIFHWLTKDFLQLMTPNIALCLNWLRVPKRQSYMSRFLVCAGDWTRAYACLAWFTLSYGPSPLQVLFCFKCMYVLPACLYAHHVCMWCPLRPKRPSGPLHLEVTVSCHVGSESQIQALCSESSYPLSHFPVPHPGFKHSYSWLSNNCF